MAARGDLYENRVTGERAVVLRGDEDGGGLSGLVHLFGLANAGRTNSKGLPSPLQLALTASEFSDVIQMTKPPVAVQRAAFSVLGAVGRRRGLRATYPEMLHPHGRVEPDPEILAAAGLD